MGVTEFDLPERFVAGSVGPPGQRTFFLQARTGPRLVSVSMEKEQLVVLAECGGDLGSVPGGRDHRVAGVQGGLGQVDAHAAGGAGDEPDRASGVSHEKHRPGGES